MDARGALAVAGERFGGRNRRALVFVAEDGAQRFDFLEIAHGRRGGVGIDIVDGSGDVFERHAHAALGAFAGGCDHVEAIGRGAIADEFSPDFGATRLGVLVFFEHQHTGAA